MDRTIANYAEKKRDEEKQKKFNLPGIGIDIDVLTPRSLMVLGNKFRYIGKLGEEIEDAD